MMQDINRTLIEAAVRKTLRKIPEAPEREIRNLVDLGMNFAASPYQRLFFRNLQKWLKNPDCPFYPMIQDLVQNVESDTLVRFGVNLGYNSFAKGTQAIRSMQKKRGFPIPWSLSFAINREEDLERLSEAIRQGVELNICTYYLRSGISPEQLVPLLKSQPDCSFFLFVQGSQITPGCAEAFRTAPNAVISVLEDKDAPNACRILHQSRLLFAIHKTVSGDIAQNHSWVNAALSLHSPFLLLFPEGSLEQQAAWHREIQEARISQRYPLLLLDAWQDRLEIHKRISKNGPLVLGFDAEGYLRTSQGVYRDEKYQLFHHPLETIFKNAAELDEK